MKKLACIFAAIVSVAANADPQIWSQVTGQKQLTNGDWILTYEVDGAWPNVRLSGTKQVGTNGFVDLASIRACTGTNVTWISCFQNQTALTGVTFPEELIKIGNKAFQNTSLSGDITISHPVELGESAFSPCTNITSVSLTAPGTTIGINQFYGDKLLRADLRGVNDIANQALCENSLLQEVTISACVTNIGASAFRNCKVCSTMNVVMPDDLDDVPDTVGTVGVKAFNAFTLDGSPSTIIIPFKGECILGSEAFSNAKATNIVFWGKIPTDIGTSAFALNNAVFTGGALGCITCSTNMDSRWVSQIRTATLTPSDETATGFPGASCFGKFTNSGKTFWLCHKASPYEGGACVHDWTAWVTNPAPTCAAAGVRTRTCTKCSAVESEPVAKLEHDWGEWQVVTDATCGVAGLKRRECGNCHEHDDEVIPALEHDYANCTTNLVATCTEAGERTFTCSHCHQNITEPIGALGHDFGDWQVTVPVTCEVDGSQTHTCRRPNCGFSESQAIDHPGHDWDGGVVFKEATETETGILRHTCRRNGCGATWDEEIPMVLGYIFVDSAAGTGGEGTMANPYGTLEEGLAAAENGDTICLKGTFTVATNATHFYTITTPGLTIDKWPSESVKPVFTSPTNKKYVPNATSAIDITVPDVTIRNLDIQFRKSALENCRGFMIGAANIVFENCDFKLLDAPGFNSGLMYYTDPAVSAGLKIRGCTFADFYWTSQTSVYMMLPTPDDLEITDSTFTNCWTILYRGGNVSSSKITFTGNRVYDTHNTGDPIPGRYDSGALCFAGDWTFGNTEFIVASNVFENVTKGGCVMTKSAGRKNFGDLKFFNNTVIGYEAALWCMNDSQTRSSAEASTMVVANNLLVNTTSLIRNDDESGWDFKSICSVRNNYLTGSQLIVGIDPASVFTVSGNGLDTVIGGDFITDRFSSKYCRVIKRVNPWLLSGWDNSGLFPTYVGAFPPLIMGCGTHLFFYY